MTIQDPAAGYDRQAAELADLYESLSFEESHEAALDLVPERPGLVLDVGAGSGRDGAWFAGRGWDVVAVEPAAGMRREGQQRHPEAAIRWLGDRLPGLEAVHRLGLMFDLVWLSAVWMHVPPTERQRAFRKLVTLLKPGGRLVLTLRHGPAPAGRPMHETTAGEIERLGLEFGLITLRVREHPARLGRSDIRWTLVCLQLPDDSTGALPLLRSVILNDSKSSTYKLALLRVIARITEIAALRIADGSNAEQVDQLNARSATVRDAQLAQLRAKEVEAAEKVRAANDRVVASLEAEREALAQTERERFVAQALSRLSAEAAAQQRREVELLAGALFDEQQALQVRQRLLDEGRSVIDRTRTATEQHAAEIAKLSELLRAGAIDQVTHARAVEVANDRALRSSQAWADGASRFLQDYAAESQDAASATERAFATAFGGAEDALVGFIATGKLQFGDLADSVLADLARMTVRQTVMAPLAGALQGAFQGGDLFGLFHQGGIAGDRPPAVRYADASVFDDAPRYHGGGFAGSGLLRDEVPIIARRGELVVPPERVMREQKSAGEQRPITVVINVTATDVGSFRASQGQIAADMARAIDRASRNR